MGRRFAACGDGIGRPDLDALREADFDLSLAGFELGDLDALLAGEESTVEGNIDENAAPEAQEATVSQPGDLWVMGGHRLLCGDSTQEDSYTVLMQGTVARMIVTDPPYNVAYQGAAGSIQNDDLGSGFYDFLLAAFRPMLTHCDGGVYIAMSSSELDTLQKAFRDAGGHWSTFIIWAKDRFTLGRADYQRQYEPILYGWREGASRHWCGDRDQGDVWSKRSTPRRSNGL